MHQEFIGKLAWNAQRRYSTFAEQLAQQRHENFTIEKAVEANVDALMSLSGGGSYSDHGIPLCGNLVRMEGAYTVEVSAAVGHPSSRNGDKSSRTFDVVWKYHARNIVKLTLEEILFSNCSAGQQIW